MNIFYKITHSTRETPFIIIPCRNFTHIFSNNIGKRSINNWWGWVMIEIDWYKFFISYFKNFFILFFNKFLECRDIQQFIEVVGCNMRLFKVVLILTESWKRCSILVDLSFLLYIEQSYTCNYCGWYFGSVKFGLFTVYCLLRGRPHMISDGWVGR